MTLITLVVLAACGSSSNVAVQSVAAVASPTPTVTPLSRASAGSEEDETPSPEFCKAFVQMIELQPEGSMTSQETADAKTIYVDALLRLADQSPPADAAHLRDLGAVMRSTIEGPSDPALAQKIDELSGHFAMIIFGAVVDCNVDLTT